MEIKKSTMNELKETWQTLCLEISKNKKFKFEMFENAFSQTYSLLLEHSAEKCLDKEYIQLIAEAFLFAKINDDTVDSTCLAASVLTERMLNNFAFRDTPNPSELTTIYILESHKEIVLNFNDVNEAISTLKEAYESAFLKKRCNY